MGGFDVTMQAIAAGIPHEYRKKILLEWLPDAKATMANESFKLLWEAYFIYIDPDGVKKENCPICLNNVLNNWKQLSKHLAAAEREYNTLEQI